jgi:hypothetical protein
MAMNLLLNQALAGILTCFTPTQISDVLMRKFLNFPKIWHLFLAAPLTVS